MVVRGKGKRDVCERPSEEKGKGGDGIEEVEEERVWATKQNNNLEEERTKHLCNPDDGGCSMTYAHLLDHAVEG